MLVAIAIFALTYLAIAGIALPLVRVDRPSAALIGAAAMVATGVLTLEEAYRAIDLDVVTLLLGMMVIAAYLTEARFFRTAAWLVTTRARSARSLLWSLVFVAGALSALLVNDTVCLMMTPLVVAVVTEAGLPALPYLLALAAGSNIGGVVTFTGNPQNMIIGQAAAGAPSYLGYALRALPVGVACLAVAAALLAWLFGADLPRGRLVERAPPRPFLDRRLTALSLLALAGFVVLAAVGVSLAGAAITCASLLILVSGRPARRILASVDWPLLLFFAGLFVVVEGLARSGALTSAMRDLAPDIGRGASGDLAFAGITVVAANVVSNVPFVMVAKAWIPEVADPAWGWTLLAVVSTLAGNLTLFGSVANIIVFESAGPRGDIGFFRFLRYGVLVTLATLVVALTVLTAERAVLGVP
jgi:Na+/H+ antiporter NhaD/arsenite permease-like protein